MVSLILAFIFITPQLWNYGDKRPVLNHPSAPLMVQSDGGSGFIFEVKASDVQASGENQTRVALRHLIQPIAGDSVQIERYEPVTGTNGITTSYKVWAHR